RAACLLRAVLLLVAAGAGSLRVGRGRFASAGSDPVPEGSGQGAVPLIHAHERVRACDPCTCPGPRPMTTWHQVPVGASTFLDPCTSRGPREGGSADRSPPVASAPYEVSLRGRPCRSRVRPSAAMRLRGEPPQNSWNSTWLKQPGR